MNGSHFPDVQRVWSTEFSKDNLFLRIVNIFILSMSMLVRLILKVHHGDKILVVTNPPTLPYVAIIVGRLKGARCFVLVYDVYPEVLVATGLIREGHPLIKIMHSMTALLFRSADAVIVLGRDMKDLVTQRYHDSGRNLHIIPNWTDAEEIKPTSRTENNLLLQQRIVDKFIVGYIGNIGRTHDIESIIASARIISERDQIHFLFVGNGAKKQWLDQYVVSSGLTNVTTLPFLDRSRQNEVHNACDLSIISFVPGMAGLSVPSRMYNMMAAGKPILAVTDGWSELARVIEEERIGWVISSHSPEEIAECIVRAQEQPDVLIEMGRRARDVVIKKYSFPQILRRYQELLATVFEGDR
jgi:colanic acid biosynthesis glycosyl transferase WcaI